MEPKATERFTNVVEDYARYRPGYPDAAIDCLMRIPGLRAGDSVADIGSGTGIMSRCLLDQGLTVYAVEPNDAMRAEAEREAGDREGFHSVAGTAEATTLADASVRLAVCAQAFHWFEPEACHGEFRRILAPQGYLAVLWNDRREYSTPLMRDYEALLLKFCPEYPKVKSRDQNFEALDTVFGSSQYKKYAYENGQYFDREGFLGRVRSCSYVPGAGHPNFQPLMDALNKLYDECAEDGCIEFVYETQVFIGALTD